MPNKIEDPPWNSRDPLTESPDSGPCFRLGFAHGGLEARGAVLRSRRQDICGAKLET